MATDRELLRDVKTQLAWLRLAFASLPAGTKIRVSALDLGGLAATHALAGDPTCDDRRRLWAEALGGRPPQQGGPCDPDWHGQTLEPDPLVRMADDAIDRIRQLEDMLQR